MVFITIQMCATVVDCFVCLRVCVNLIGGLLVNAQVSFTIDRIYIFNVNFTFRNKKVDMKLVLQLTELLIFHSKLYWKSASSKLR